jgi:hypothetical protein
MARHRLVLLTAIALLFTAAGVRADESRQYVPGDAEMIASFNLRQLLGSELVAQHKDKVEALKGMLNNFLQNNDEAKKYYEALGLDPFRDFNSITVAAPASLDPEKGLVIIDGKFNAERFHKTAAQAAKDYGDVLKIGRIGSRAVWEVNAPGHDKPLFVLLAGPSTLLAAHSKSVLETALDQKQANLSKEVKELLKTTSAKQSLYFVATGKAAGNAFQKIAEHNPNPQNKMVLDSVAPVVKKLEGFSAAITVGKNIDFQLGIGTRDEKAADVLSKQINGAMAMVRGMVGANAKNDPNAQAAAEVLKTVQATTQETTVLVRGQVSAEVFEQAMKNASEESSKFRKRPLQ